MEARLAKLGNLVLENNSKKDMAGANNQVKCWEHEYLVIL